MSVFIVLNMYTADN